jgi:hypothetical protein
MTTEEHLKMAEGIFQKCLQIMKDKNHDYAGDVDFFKNLSLSEYLGVTKTENGIVTRFLDKVIRICNGLQFEYQVKDENMFATLEDAINYLTLLYMYIKTHPKPEKT